MTIIKTITFTCSDGKEFTDERLAKEHEQQIAAKAKSRYEDWIKTSYSAQRLLKVHSLDEFGTWRVQGEDSSTVFGGHHYQPELGVFEGRLSDVIKHAVDLPGFYTWGGGGDISLIKIIKL
jgi:hypothetical protein